ncbi:ankyrin repeat protein [Pandoravirus inopinatum]|uniref:Ankyrin repeat protein n=1 Tax=Pandoravirus inopinatum TaxID=1605721 RepID=A0A0B5JDV8_9VIRU|nr:ankyrin repeat protein [Pandoravirus inopinatum]AJF97932.1 ankyrin repeat protein [Pandoravirus inopinatum]
MQKRPLPATTYEARPRKRTRSSLMAACTSHPANCGGHGDRCNDASLLVEDDASVSIDNLPDEILVSIFDCLPCLTRCGNVAAVCQRWRAVALDSTAGARPLCASSITNNPCLSAASMLHADCVDEALRLGWSWHGTECEYPTRAGRVDLMDRFRARGCPFDARHVAVVAARAGRLHVLRHLCDQGLLAPPPRGTELISAAAAGGHIACIEFARGIGFLWDENACTWAARNGHLACLRYLYESGCPWDERASEAAAGYDPGQNPYSPSKGHIDCLRYLHEHGCPWAEGTCEIAAQRGAVACLVYALDHDCPRDESDLGVAAVYSSEVAILDALQDRGHRWDACATATAAEYGRWDLIEILRAYGCPWDDRVCTDLASMGDLDLLQRARADGCPWEPEACMREAIRHGHVDIVRWLCKNAFGRDDNDHVLKSEYCASAVYGGHRDVLACLVEHGCPWDPMTIAQSLDASFDMDCLEYAISRGMITGVPAHCATRFCAQAARGGRSISCASFMPPDAEATSTQPPPLQRAATWCVLHGSSTETVPSIHRRPTARQETVTSSACPTFASATCRGIVNPTAWQSPAVAWSAWPTWTPMAVHDAMTPLKSPPTSDASTSCVICTKTAARGVPRHACERPSVAMWRACATLTVTERRSTWNSARHAPPTMATMHVCATWPAALAPAPPCRPLLCSLLFFAHLQSTRRLFYHSPFSRCFLLRFFIVCVSLARQCLCGVEKKKEIVRKARDQRSCAAGQFVEIRHTNVRGVAGPLAARHQEHPRARFGIGHFHPLVIDLSIEVAHVAREPDAALKLGHRPIHVENGQVGSGRCAHIAAAIVFRGRHVSRGVFCCGQKSLASVVCAVPFFVVLSKNRTRPSSPHDKKKEGKDGRIAQCMLGLFFCQKKPKKETLKNPSRPSVSAWREKKQCDNENKEKKQTGVAKIGIFSLFFFCPCVDHRLGEESKWIT